MDLTLLPTKFPLTVESLVPSNTTQNTLLRELPSKARHNLEVAVERFSKPAPIRPLDVFNLNLASGASIVGLILTYIIVLLQFKVSEDRGDTSTTINHVSD